MFRLIIKSFRWIFRHFALFLLILLLLVAGDGFVSVASNWEEVTSDPSIDSPIPTLSQELPGNIPSRAQSAICSDKETDLLQQRAELRSKIKTLREDYSGLYFYQIDEMLSRELEIRKIDSELQLINQAIRYLQRCQAIASNEDTRSKCEDLRQRCFRKASQCKSLKKSTPKECASWERHIPPWPGICDSQKNNLEACYQSQASICSARSSICSLLKETPGGPLGPFEPVIEPPDSEGSVITFLVGLMRFWKEFISQSPKAFAIVVSIVLSPLLINGIIFFGLAKLIERTYRVRLNDSPSMPISEISAPQDLIGVDLEANSELLLKPEFIRNVPDKLQADTKALLNNSTPFTSLAAGLHMLTRFRTNIESGSIAVKIAESNDTETKISVVELDNHSEVVLSPRQIVGIVQDKDKPLKISSRWLIFKPSAWLAGQLRVLVFKGPARLILKGTRGIFLQKVNPSTPCLCEGVIGYSANLVMESSRTETFWAFHRNKRELFKHRFSGAEGVILQEIHPQRKKVNISGWSLQRLGDLILNLFGI
ncbi:hypothetical protein [Marinobacter sp. SS8-8]|uniref:hypothetical protein n=1 Tax=Marinobacter sp. SS8-8 TaxID=3050452 RepID=UPI0026E0678A|nr:hypothetical protein [Marinobacter sp. SS8-8]